MAVPSSENPATDKVPRHKTGHVPTIQRNTGARKLSDVEGPLCTHLLTTGSDALTA